MGQAISPPMIDMFDEPCHHIPWLTTLRSVTSSAEGLKLTWLIVMSRNSMCAALMVI